ncbi:MAG: Cytochrome c biogenesis protein, transmembrane region [Candidatus Azambacteria bacterium GW2011_GWA1_44_9]|uniref:Cytochrome c biogenesis protein, transmembrane region n=1 Tax=Candidatus Azambacteria bacterium GW2011_GWA1_44_9 TaxID=1618610 RepID=A0A0G1KBR4_9BACT|nr:MAG: Cytochrome c biogenesis protein, transmembrane region [Candidatus Azambacteria bacterium GW2011_GWA1_44_9]
MVALFAPCCITFLLPSYLANIFKEKGRVLWMTLIFGIGIATILVPTALGIRAVGQFFQDYHTQTYVVGGAFMVLLGLMQLTGKKVTLPMIHLTIDLNKRHDPWSVYLLGVFSGITSSCCTPVLAGILTISFLSPTFFWAGLAGLSYVFGMVVPLVVLALLLEKINWTTLPRLRGKTIGLVGKQILVTDAIAGILYLLVGIVFTFLALTGRITMGTELPIEQTLGTGTMNLVRLLRTIPGVEFFFAAAVFVAIGAIIIKVYNERRRP